MAALARERRTDDVHAWMEARDHEGFSTSAWMATELSSALSLKQRTGQMEFAARAEMLATFARLYRSAFEILPILDAHFRAAASFVDRAELGLRAGDALHLAIASAHGHTVCTLDRRMAEAGGRLAIAVELI